MVVIQKRLIYTSGTFRFSDELRYCRRIIVCYDILRFPPFTVYASEKSNPPTYFLGYASLWIDKYVIRKIPLEYTEQILLLHDNLEFQLYVALGCFSNVTVDNLVAHRASIPLAGSLEKVSPPVATFPIMPYSELKFKMPLGTRIAVTATGEEIIGCNDFIPGGSLPSLPDLESPYPNDRPRIEDPPRSEPYPDENPGDTAPATEEDPDSSLLPVIVANRCIRVRNKGILSGDIVFENFFCGIRVETPSAEPYNGQATVSIIGYDENESVVFSSIQASYASNAVDWQFVDNDSVRQPQYSYGSCASCNVIPA